MIAPPAANASRAPGEGRPENIHRDNRSAARSAWQAFLDRLDPIGIVRAVLVALTIFWLAVAWSWR
jgi:hypothetical protein